MIKAWLRDWLGIDSGDRVLFDELRSTEQRLTERLTGLIQSDRFMLDLIRTEVRELSQRADIISQQLEIESVSRMALDGGCRILQNEIKELRAEVTRLSIAQYVPPQQPEPERKVIKTRNFREYSAIVEQEQKQEIERELNAI
jgi:hypothetical protein